MGVFPFAILDITVQAGFKTLPERFQLHSKKIVQYTSPIDFVPFRIEVLSVSI
jgi:hypothetical protein